MAYLSKYGVARHIRIPLVKRAVVDHAVSADWTPSAGDCKISKDGGAAANVTNLPTAIAMGNSTIWDFSLTATEMQAAEIVVTVADSTTKAVEDSAFAIETYGNASAQHAFDLGTASTAQTGDSFARIGAAGAGLTALGDARVANLDATVSSRLAPTVAARTLDVTATGEAGIDWANIGAPTTVVALTGTTVGTVTTLTNAPSDSSGTTTLLGRLTAGRATNLDNLDATVSSRLAPTVAARTLDVTATGEAGVDWANIGAPTTVVNLSGTTISAVSGAVGSVAAGGITAPSFGAGAIDAAALATDAGQEIADRLLARSLAGSADGGRDVRSALRFLRNKKAIVAATLTVYQEDDTTSAWTGAVTTAAGNPIDSLDPA